MPGHEFFERLMPRFALQAGAARKTADHQANAERLISKAEYECAQMRRDLMAALAVPLRDRVVEIVEPIEPAASALEAAPAGRPAKAA